MRLYYGIWCMLLLWSVGSLLFYSGPSNLGRAAIADETFHFGLPLLAALFVSIVGFGLPKPKNKLARAAPFFATISLTLLEVTLYLTVLW